MPLILPKMGAIGRTLGAAATAKPKKKPGIPEPYWDPVEQQNWRKIAHDRFGLNPDTGQPYPAPTPKPPGPPPISPEGQSQRIQAGGTLSSLPPGINNDLMQAAMHYGVSPTVEQVGLDAQGNPTTTLANVTADPNSVSAGIDRTLDLGTRNLNETTASGNNFFSGYHQRGQSELEGTAARDRAQAGVDYHNLVNSILTGQWTPALTQRDIGIGQATQTDIANAPPSSGPPPPGEVPLPAPSPKLAAFALAKARGDTKFKNGKFYYKRSDGKWIPM